MKQIYLPDVKFTGIAISNLTITQILTLDSYIAVGLYGCSKRTTKHVVMTIFVLLLRLKRTFY